MFWALKKKQALVTQLAAVYTEEKLQPLTTEEWAKVERIKRIIEGDITRHSDNAKLARMVCWSESSLKRAFRHANGMGLYAYLRRLRMQTARELLLKGEQVKTVAPAVGMRPAHFVMEFQKYFGYRASSLKAFRK